MAPTWRGIGMIRKMASAKIDEAIRRNAAISKAIEDNNAVLSKQLSVALGELAYHVKADILSDREELRKLHNENVEIRSRLDDLEQRLKLTDSH